MIEPLAVDALVAYRRAQAVANVAGALPTLCGSEAISPKGDLAQHGLVPLIGIVVAEPLGRRVAVEIPKVVPDMRGDRLVPVLIHRVEGIQQREIRFPRGDHGPKQGRVLSIGVGRDLHVLREDIPFAGRERVV